MAPFVRVDVWNLAPNDPILTYYARAVDAMQGRKATDRTSWKFQAGIHDTLLDPPPAGWSQCMHQSWYFVSWHRAYLYFFERIVRAEVIRLGGPATWALPYWNYDGGGTHNQLPLSFRDPTTATGAPNPLYVRGRRLTGSLGLPPQATTPKFALARPIFTGGAELGGDRAPATDRYARQTGRLESTPHNDVHDKVGGLMGDTRTAAADPIFWLHHANIDRLWWLWQQSHPAETDPAWTTPAFPFFDVGGVAVSRSAGDVQNTVTQCDYTYDPAAAASAVPPTPPRQPLLHLWPSPWPKPPGTPHIPRSSRGGLRKDGAPMREMLGATAKPIRLVGSTVRVPVVIDQRAASLFMQSVTASESEHRAFLDLEGVDAERNPGTVYGVYVNLPAQPTDEEYSEHHAGNISLFGIERARNPARDQHPHAMHFSMEITEILDRSASKGSWKEGQRIDVTLEPITLIAPADHAEKLAAPLPATAHPDIPITIDRISVHYS